MKITEIRINRMNAPRRELKTQPRRQPWAADAEVRWRSISRAADSLGLEIPPELTLRIGDLELPVVATITGFPADFGFQTAVGPQVLVRAGTLDRAGLLGFGSLVRYETFLAVADEEAGCTLGSRFLVEQHPEKVRAGYALGEVGGVGTQIELIAVPGAAEQAMTRKQLLDEVETELGELVRREERRAVDEYRPTKVEGGGLTRSPLAGFPAEAYILGYFQNNPDGTIQTPLVDDAGQVPDAVRQRVRQLESINAVFNRRKLVASVPQAPAPSPQTPKKSEVAQKQEQIAKYEQQLLTVKKNEEYQGDRISSRRERGLFSPSAADGLCYTE